MTPVAGTPHADDLALVRAALAGDRAAADRVAERLACIARILRARARSLCGGLPEHDLLDLAQDVATKVYERLRAYEGRAALESWVFAFCEGELRNALRRRQRRSGDTGLDAGALAAPPLEVEDFADLYRCLDRLGAGERELVRKKHYDGLVLEAIATRSGTNLNTVKSRYYRALVQLRRCLERNDHEDRR